MQNARVAKLDSLAALDIRGADAAAFLHAQLCADVLELAPGKCRFTAWCNPKGRVIASFLLARADTGFRALLCRDIAARVLQKLGMYVLRARVELVDRGDLAAAGCYAAPAGTTPPLPGLEGAWDYAEDGSLAAAALPGTGGMRWLLCGAPPALAPFNGAAGDVPGWVLEDVLAGIPWVGLPLSEEFLPQEIDLERLGGLSYTKGCFPGQEIVARVHSRGRLKRGLHRFNVAAVPPLPGARIVAADGATAGIVIAAARTSVADSSGLAVAELERAGRDALHLERPDGAPVHLDVRRQD